MPPYLGKSITASPSLDWMRQGNVLHGSQFCGRRPRPDRRFCTQSTQCPTPSQARCCLRNPAPSLSCPAGVGVRRGMRGGGRPITTGRPTGRMRWVGAAPNFACHHHRPVQSLRPHHGLFHRPSVRAVRSTVCAVCWPLLPLSRGKAVSPSMGAVKGLMRSALQCPDAGWKSGWEADLMVSAACIRREAMASTASHKGMPNVSHGITQCPRFDFGRGRSHERLKRIGNGSCGRSLETSRVREQHELEARGRDRELLLSCAGMPVQQCGRVLMSPRYHAGRIY
jgi:hypothetical protein